MVHRVMTDRLLTAADRHDSVKRSSKGVSRRLLALHNHTAAPLERRDGAALRTSGAAPPGRGVIGQQVRPDAVAAPLPRRDRLPPQRTHQCLSKLQILI
jgi:hypothetical protein